MDLSFIGAGFRSLVDKYPVFAAMLLYPLITGAANLGVWYFSSPAWPLFLSTRPRTAAALKVLKAAGFDPVSLVKWTYVMVTGRSLPPSPPAPKADDAPPAPPPPPPEAPPPDEASLFKASIPQVAVLALVWGLLFGALIPTSGCSALNSKNVNTALDIAHATCVILHGQTTDGTVSDICATAEELSPLVRHIVALRAARAHVGTSPKPVDACTVGD